MTDADAPYHAHVYYSPDERPTAAALREDLARDAAIFFTGAMVDRPIGPHPIPQFEVHFAARSCEVVSAAIAETGLTALILLYIIAIWAISLRRSCLPAMALPCTLIFVF